MKKIILQSAAVISLIAASVLCLALNTPQGEMRSRARGHYQDGNYREALEIWQKLALDEKSDPMMVGRDLSDAIGCLVRLGREGETDTFRDDVIEIHRNNWRLLWEAARTLDGGNHNGYIVAGQFYRGSHRGGGRYVNTSERDRARALQLMVRAMKILEESEEDARFAASFYLGMADMIMRDRGYGRAWRLQYLTDLETLPDYEDAYGYGVNTGAPVHADGTPVYYYVPASFDTAVCDGERWRWALSRAVDLDPSRKNEVLNRRATFLRQQFGVQTMADYGRYFAVGREGDIDRKTSGTYALHTLSEGETIAGLADGIKRFGLPDEFNFIRIFRQIADDPSTGYGSQALKSLAIIFEDRRQYPKAAGLWRRNIEEYGSDQTKERRLDQITGKWGRFEPVMTQAAGRGASVEYRFRNGHEVHFEAHEIQVEKLLDDVIAYLKSNPRTLDWDRMNISDIGYRLVRKKEKKYIGRKKASWKVDLEPGSDHFDRRVTISTPLVNAGAYLLTARMEDGNESRIIIWLDDTVVIKKPLDGRTYYLVADSRTGKPVPGAALEIFGYRQLHVDWKKIIGRRYDVETRRYSARTDNQGQVILDEDRQPKNFSWIIMAKTAAGRFAYLGFTGVWYRDYRFQKLDRAKAFNITDRPVYRPGQEVRFKFWIGRARYDHDGDSDYADRSFNVEIWNPMSEKVFQKEYRSDGYGGFEGTYLLPSKATLGQYRLSIPGLGGGSFRVEEYKKPEFEVKVEAPSAPIMLGEKIKAVIEAGYYFGAPVTSARVKYKVLRWDHEARWYPPSPWDWFYGPGYWWFGYRYNWYPGWAEWAVLPPVGWWYPRSSPKPEVVREFEGEIGEDGRLEVIIDTSLAKEVYGDRDHRYEITAEVTDQSRRTIVGSGNILVARRPFRVYTWVDRGYYRVGDTIRADFSARTLDNKPVDGSGRLTLYRISYRKNEPVETSVGEWDLESREEGRTFRQMKASRPGQYRLSCRVTDWAGHTIEGGYIFTVIGEGFEASEFRFSNIELVADRKEYAPGDKVNLMINTDRTDSTVALFVRPSGGIYREPEILHLDGKSRTIEIDVGRADMPNFFVEAVTISDGKVHTELREIVVPPEKKVLNVEVVPSSQTYLPGEGASVKIRLTDFFGRPLAGSAAVSVYDKSVEYIFGGSNVPEIKAFFWKWRRRHSPVTESNLGRFFPNLVYQGEEPMRDLGVFGRQVTEELAGLKGGEDRYGYAEGESYFQARKEKAAMSSMRLAESPAPMGAVMEEAVLDRDVLTSTEAAPPAEAEPVIRKEFADTAYWNGSIETDAEGFAEITFRMPENLTGWKIRAWAMGKGLKVGEGTAEVVTAKNLILRLQSPRFFVEKDEVVLSANIHNYLETDKMVRAVLELEDGSLNPLTDLEQRVKVGAGGEARVDWRVRAVREGEAVVRMKAVTDEESDAVEMRFPVYVHGMAKTVSSSGAIRPGENGGTIIIDVPGERRVNESRLEVRYSPTLAGAMVDALPYLVSYPYGCTEQTLNRFLPTVITQKILLDMGLDLEAIGKWRTNLNAQEIGDDQDRATGWRRWRHNPVFDEEAVGDMVREGLRRLGAMQLSDGGWGWFSGWGEHSYPHTTATVVHGLQTARGNDVAVDQGVLSRGVAWLESYQDGQLRLLKNAAKEKKPWKPHADNIDALVYMVLADEGNKNRDMLEFLYRDRDEISVYAMAMYGMALYRQKEIEKLSMIMSNIEQYLVEDDENQTAYLKLPNQNYWWYWYGSEYEAHAYYLKLLALTDPESVKASRLVKYLLNNRKHATYWQSTRDTALCIEALADYLKASGEDRPDMSLEILIDGIKYKEVSISRENLFTFDNRLILTGDAVESGRHTIELRKKGKGPLYYNAYLTYFSLEDFITGTGLEIKVDRKVYRLKRAEKTIKAKGMHGQALDQAVVKYEREELGNMEELKSGDLVEVELEIDSKNDYEYLVFEDMKAAGFEPVEVRSGYVSDGPGAFMELRDERVSFFMRVLPRGKHSISYRLRAEIPGKFGALPARGWAMYAPELKANSDEIKLLITD